MTCIKYFIIPLTLTILFSGCNKSSYNLLSTYNNSTYILSTTSEVSPNDSVQVNFRFNFANEETSANPVQVNAGCSVFKTTENELDIKIGKSDMPIQFKVTSIGYFSIETLPVITSEVDEISIEVNFSEDDRPMVHCEESGFNQKGTDAGC